MVNDYSYLAMVDAHLVRRSKAFVDVRDSTLHGCPLNGAARVVQVVESKVHDVVVDRGNLWYISIQAHCRRPTTYVREAMLSQILAQMLGQVRPQRLFASDHREAAGKFGRHAVSRLPHLLLIRFRREVLGDKLAGGDAGDRHGTVDHRQDDLQDI